MAVDLVLVIGDRPEGGDHRQLKCPELAILGLDEHCSYKRGRDSSFKFICWEFVLGEDDVLEEEMGIEKRSNETR